MPGRSSCSTARTPTPGLRRIIDRWIEANAGTGRVSGSRPIDGRMALIEHFRDQAAVMIATEAASEGVNLQFCSLCINYDLPWNPQRIEQRIGRCHRYGQTHDVVVINFLNERNEADRRVHELLSEKFKLFEGILGSSDEVLGAIVGIRTGQKPHPALARGNSYAFTLFLNATRCLERQPRRRSADRADQSPLPRD